MSNQQLIPHLFRTEYSKIVAVLSKRFGFEHIEIAEDIVSDTFLKASETWKLKGVPDNAVSWLYKVAENKTKDYFKRESIYKNKVLPNIIIEESSEDFSIDLSESNIKDSQLRMIFTVCDPLVAIDAQITFALRVLCGFSIEEIANALLTNKVTINKRLLRTRKTFKENKIQLTIPNKEKLKVRLDNVLLIIYLLFNEGYYSSSSEKKVRKELCIEAMRLLFLLLNHSPSNLPHANALMALFCFHSSRFEARFNQSGKETLYEDQDQAKWDNELIKKGEDFLNLSSKGNAISKYHLEASIAFWHSRIGAQETEKWKNILQLYNRLLQMEYSPIVALNRTYALSKVMGKEYAVKEALKIELTHNYLYHSLLAYLYEGWDSEKEKLALINAIKLSNNDSEKVVLKARLDKAFKV